MTKQQKIILTEISTLFIALIGLFIWLSVNQPVTQKATTKRIATTTMAQTEIFDRLNLPLVAVPTPSTTKLPKRYAKLPQIGNHVSPNLEALVAAKPDLVYLDAVIASDYQSKLQQNHIASQTVNLDRLSDLKQTIKKIGSDYNRTDLAKEVIATLDLPKSPVKKQPKVLLLIGMPGGGFLQGTKSSFIGDLIQTAGGKIVAPKSSSPYEQLNMEMIQQANPDVIITMAHAMPKSVFASIDNLLNQPNWQNVKAVKEHRIYQGQDKYFTMTANLHAKTIYQQIVNWLNH